MAVDRSRLPPLAGIPHYQFPHIERRTLASGLRVWTIEHRAVPLVSVLGVFFDVAYEFGKIGDAYDSVIRIA